MKFVVRPQYPGEKLTALREAATPISPPIEWRVIEEPLVGPDDFAQRIVDHVVAGGSMCCMGCAGTGKSVVLRTIKSALEAQGLTVAAICLTHTGACNLGAGASTAHSFVIKHVLHSTFPPGSVVLIEEISFMSIDLLSGLEQTRLSRCRLFFGGIGGSCRQRAIAGKDNGCPTTSSRKTR